jgi:predicted ATP-grasp superfamily ATP-dependent carboligase
LNPENCIKSLISFIRDYHIDLLIPTCEEVFYWSRFKEQLESHVELLVDDFDKLRTLHHKADFLTLAPKSPVHIPDSQLIYTFEEAIQFSKRHSKCVFKPVYSRFATHTLIDPSERKLAKALQSKRGEWVGQEFLPGQEFCSYSVAHEGRLLAHVCYEPVLRAGLGSGIYFIPCNLSEITEFVRLFVMKNKFTGQIGFDFRVNTSGTFVIDCNPRATSGVHLFKHTYKQLGRALLGKGLTGEGILATKIQPRMIAGAMLAFLPSTLTQAGGGRNWMNLWKNASDVIASELDPWPKWGQFISFAEIIGRSVLRRSSIRAASTADIEWDGEEI